MAKVNELVYAKLRQALICGRLTPGRAVSLRSLAAELDVSPMPIREAISRLVAEGALEISQRRIVVPAMDQQRLLDLIELRLAIEPKLARRALAALGGKEIQEIVRLNAETDRAIQGGDTEAYILSNYQFHRAIFGRSGALALIPVLDQVWLQLGPFSRIVYGRLGTAQLEDKHLQAIAAIKTGDAFALGEAIAADIEDGRDLLVAEPMPDDAEAAERSQPAAFLP
jgi:DNA-binding GntR family transcriptional regulator